MCWVYFFYYEILYIYIYIYISVRSNALDEALSSRVQSNALAEALSSRSVNVGDIRFVADQKIIDNGKNKGKKKEKNQVIEKNGSKIGKCEWKDLKDLSPKSVINHPNVYTKNGNRAAVVTGQNGRKWVFKYYDNMEQILVTSNLNNFVYCVEC